MIVIYCLASEVWQYYLASEVWQKYETDTKLGGNILTLTIDNDFDLVYAKSECYSVTHYQNIS